MATNEQWQQVQKLFHAALQREPEDRSAFLDEACGGNEALLREVARLISAHETEDHFVDLPASVAAADVLDDGREFEPGQLLSHYEIHSLLGEGGMGRVYLAEDTKLKRNVAIKVLPLLLPSVDRANEDARRRLFREAQAAAALDHPNICAIYEVDEASDRSFIAMQYVEGETLEARMARERLSLDESLNVASQVASALAEAHAHSIVHRDIKPSNIMLGSRGQVKVLDFGLAKTANAFSTRLDEAETKLTLTTPGMILGTIPYMSPEQLRGETVDARSDIFSLGAVLYEMLSGRPAFGRNTNVETVAAIMHEEPFKLSSIDQNLPKALEDLVNRCLAKDVAQRYQTIQQVAHDLNATRKGDRVDIGEPISRSVIRDFARHRSVVLTAAALVIAVALFGYYSYFAKSRATIDSVAVLPFVNISNDASTEYLSDGISDSIINSLSQLENLKKVIPFSSVLSYKGKQLNPQAVGRELGVGAVLTGRLTLRGDEVLVSTEFVDVKDNKRLWGGQYSHKLADVFKLQGEIARDISEKLRLKLTGEQEERLTKPETESGEAYRLYLQGLYYWQKNTDEATLKSGEYFQQAIEADPNFALAYVGLANYYSVMANFGNMRPNEAWPKAEAAAVKALAIDDRLAEAHLSLARVKIWYDWDWPGAEREFQRAIELEPELVHRDSIYPRLLEAMGRFDEAIARLNKADGRLPGQRGPGLAGILRRARRYDQAIEEHQKDFEREPNRRGINHMQLGVTYVLQGRYKEALAEVREARPAVTQPRHLAEIGYVYAAAGKKDEATKILEEVKALTGERYNLGTHIAAIYAALGNKNEALAWLKKACDEHEQGVVVLKVDPRFDPLRSDPRFMDLLRRVKLAP